MSYTNHPCKPHRYSWLLLLLSFCFSAPVFSQPYYEEAGWAVHGELTYTAFGWSMSSAGDVNGDGFDDMIVTAIDYSNPVETNGEEGKVYIYYGSPTGLSETPAWQYESNNDSSVLGFSSDGGDLNGDGYSDIAIGCLQWSNDQYNEGRIYFWYGSPDGPSNDGPDWTMEFDQTFALLGGGVALDGDINSDGYNDLFFSAKMWDGPELDEGKTWLYWGSPDGPVDSGWSWDPDQAETISGFPVNYAGDLNADGYDDVIIGANGYDYDLPDDGLTVVFYGSADGLSEEPDWEASCGQKKANFGHWADGAGDVNGDGYDDVVVGALLYESDLSELNEGRIFIYLGGPDGLGDTVFWYGEVNQIDAKFGYSCAGAGDINGDGYDDIVGGAKFWENGEMDEGGAFVWFGSPTGPKYDYCWMAESNNPNGYYGRHVGGDGDYNNDGYSDFMVGAYRYTEILEADGKGFVYYGAPREAQFHYPKDSFCIDGENPTAIVDGVSGGTFSSAEAVVNAATGEIDLSASGSGWKRIYYESTGLCPVDSFDIFIEEPSDEEMFDFTETAYCISGTDPSPVILTATPGYFSSPDAVINAITGVIDLEATGEGGPFMIYYTGMTPAGCELISSDVIYIDYDASFFYEKDTFCLAGDDPLPVIDDVEEGFFSSDDCVVNAATGKINLAASGTGGPFIIYYHNDNSCPDDSLAVWIFDIDIAAANFHYAQDSFCIDDINPVAIFDGMSGGTFSSVWAIVDPVTGEIDLEATGEGEFEILYSVTDMAGCEVEYVSTVTIDNVDATMSYDNTVYFQNEADPTPTVVDPSGTFYSTPDGIIFNASGTIDLDASAAGSYMIYYFVDDLLCSATDSFALEIFPPCAAPVEVVIDELTPTTAEVSWTEDVYYNDYNVYLVTEDDSILYVVTDETSILFSDLIPQMSYTVYVFTLCPGDSTGSAASVEFTLPVGINDLSMQNQVHIYPNPADNNFTVEFISSMRPLQIALMSAEGKTVVSTTPDQFSNTNSVTVETTQLPPGIYLVRIALEDQQLSTSIVIQ